MMARILIVDDHPIMLSTLRRTVELDKEHTVTVVARSADEAVELLRDNKVVDGFDVAIVDGLGSRGAIVAAAIQHLGKPVIGFSVHPVNFGDINLEKGVEREVILAAIDELTAPAGK